MTTKEKAWTVFTFFLTVLFLVLVLIWNYYHGDCHLEDSKWDAFWCFLKEIG